MTQLKETKIGKSTITKLLLNDHELSPDLVFESWLRSNFFLLKKIKLWVSMDLDRHN